MKYSYTYCDVQYVTTRSFVYSPTFFVYYKFVKYKNIRSLGRPRRRWVDNIKMNLREIGWDGVYWMAMGQDRAQWRALVNTVLNLRVP
jgi:hypothetical protein